MAPPRARAMLWNSESWDHLLPGVRGILLIGRQARVVEGADRGRVVSRAARDIAVVVADEPFSRARAAGLGLIELWVPRVLADPDVVPERAERRAVELDARVDAVVGEAVWWQRPLGTRIARALLI